MLLMPYLSRLVPPFLPVGVVLLVVINLLVFFGWQQGDDARFRRAVDYYAGSVLAEVEPRLYRDYLSGRGDSAEVARIDRIVSQRGDFATLLRHMDDDRDFMNGLRQGRLISPEDELYGSWRQARQSFDGLMAGVVGERHAFRGDAPTLQSALSSLFLHADLSHLLGNLLVLVLVGPAVEGLVGSLAFLGIYLAGGLAGAGLWMLAGTGSALIGASGAIAAVMGAFSVLLRWRRIPFFYFVIVYFDIVRAPALLALPIWLLSEALQLYWQGGEGVAYQAHIGGLLTGGLLALPLLARAQSRLALAAPVAAARPASAPDLADYLGRARVALQDADFDLARQRYGQAAAHAGRDLAAWQECLNVLRLMPEHEEFHKASRAFCRLALQHPPAQAMLPAVFMDYLQLAQPRPQFSASLLFDLAGLFLAQGRSVELLRAFRLLQLLAPEHPRCQQLAQAVSRLA